VARNASGDVGPIGRPRLGRVAGTPPDVSPRPLGSRRPDHGRPGDRRNGIVFHGEIYNVGQLRRRLVGREQESVHGDTAIMLRALGLQGRRRAGVCCAAG